ncbi:hypothetical protein R6Q59_022969 [Mikania micrantha]
MFSCILSTILSSNGMIWSILFIEVSACQKDSFFSQVFVCMSSVNRLQFSPNGATYSFLFIFDMIFTSIPFSDFFKSTYGCVHIAKIHSIEIAVYYYKVWF